jgi:hypothetical protein
MWSKSALPLGERRGVETIVPRGVINSERAKQPAEIAHRKLSAVFRGKSLRQEAPIVSVVASNPNRDPSRKRRCRGTPVRRYHERRVVLITADREQCSDIGDELPFAAKWGPIPEWIGRVHLIDSGEHHPDRPRVRLAPESKVRRRKPCAKRRGECRSEHEIAKVVETEDENAARLADMALHVSRD